MGLSGLGLLDFVIEVEVGNVFYYWFVDSVKLDEIWEVVEDGGWLGKFVEFVLFGEFFFVEEDLVDWMGILFLLDDWLFMG
jgi:hypothetical protein